MSYQRYTVMVEQRKLYSADVIAFSADEAKTIAENAVSDPAANKLGIQLMATDFGCDAELAKTQPRRDFLVRFDHICEHEIPLPANNAEEAVIHAQRIIGDSHPFEADIIDSRLGQFRAREVLP